MLKVKALHGDTRVPSSSNPGQLRPIVILPTAGKQADSVYPRPKRERGLETKHNITWKALITMIVFIGTLHHIASFVSRTIKRLGFALTKGEMINDRIGQWLLVEAVKISLKIRRPDSLFDLQGGIRWRDIARRWVQPMPPSGRNCQRIHVDKCREASTQVPKNAGRWQNVFPSPDCMHLPPDND